MASARGAGPTGDLRTAAVPAVDARSLKRLEAVVPPLRSRVITLLRLMHAHGHPMTVTSGRRSQAEQQALYAQGRTAPGPIVTQLDGVKKQSRHQQGRAVDCAFVTGPGKVSFDGPWEIYGAMARELGLVWGGSWTRFPDRPHVEWLGPEDG